MLICAAVNSLNVRIIIVTVELFELVVNAMAVNPLWRTSSLSPEAQSEGGC